MTKTTTLGKILAAGPCGQAPVSYANQGTNFGKTELAGWLKLLAGLEAKYGKPPDMFGVLPFADILEVNGLADALWCCRTKPEFNGSWRWFEAWCIMQRVEFLVPELRPAYTALLAHVEGHGGDLKAAFKEAKAGKYSLVLARRARGERMTIPQAVEWSTTEAAAREFSEVELATALVEALRPDRGYSPGMAAYYAIEAATQSRDARKAQAAKFLEIVK